MIALSFDSYALNDGTINTTDTDIYNAPQRTIQAEKLAEADGSVIVKTSFEPKVFTVDGYIKGTDGENLENLVDLFKQNLNKLNQNFDIDYSGGTRRYIATPRNMVLTRPKGLDTATFSVEFYCASPVGMDITSTTLLPATAITSSTALNAISVEGSYIAEPLLTLTLTAVTGGTTNKTVTISNDATLRGISITRDWANSDVIEIDSLNKSVYVNNTIVDFSGQFPSWEAGNGAIAYLDDFTTRTASITATYTRRYL